MSIHRSDSTSTTGARPALATLFVAACTVFFAAGSAQAEDDEEVPAATIAPQQVPQVDLPEVDGPEFRWPGEELYYTIQLNGAEAMRATVRAGHPRRKDQRAYVPISAVAKSVGFFDNVYPLYDRAHTFLRPGNHHPIRSEKHFEERGKTRTYEVDYTHDAYRAKVKKAKGKRTSRFNYAIPDSTHDMISWMYDLRSRGELAVGDELTFYVYDGWKLSQVDLEVVEKTDVRTPAGWFKAFKLAFVREVLESKRVRNDDGEFDEPELRLKTPRDYTGHLWLSRDENRLPIKVSIDTKFGLSEALLVKYKPHQASKTKR